MTPWLEAAFTKYFWVWIGLTVGLAAKYAMLMKRGVKIRPWLVAADLLMLPLVALIAYTMVTKLGATGEASALMTALATVGADRLVKLYTERFLRGVETEAQGLAANILGEARKTVATEQSAARVIGDTVEGRAPEEYVALKRSAIPPKAPGDGST